MLRTGGALLALLFLLAAPAHSAAKAASPAVDADDQENSTETVHQAQLTNVEGTVYLHLDGQAEDEFIPAEAGAPLGEGDMIRTGSDGKAELTLDGDSVIELPPGTDFIVNSLDREETEFHLGIGQFLAKIKSLFSNERMEFHSYNSVAAVRGTELAMDCGEDADCSVGVFDEGKVAVLPEDAPATATPIVLEPGQELDDVGAGKSTQVVPLKRMAPLQTSWVGVRQRVVFWRTHWSWRSRAQIRKLHARLMKVRRIRARNLKHVRAAQRRRRYARIARRRAALRRRRAQRRARRRAKRRGKRKKRRD